MYKRQGLLAERALQVMTPTGSADNDLVAEDIVISILPDRTIFLENDEIPISELTDRLATIKEETPTARIVLRGDVSASYEIVMDVIVRCNESGLNNIALATRDSAE